MAFRGQNAPNVINRAPNSQRAGSHLPAYPVYAPAELEPNIGGPTHYTPFGITQPVYAGGAAVEAHGYDGLAGRMQRVPQADFYNSEPNPWPANGVYDVPNAWHGILPLVRLEPSTSAHPGASIAGSPAGPAMLFHAPPVFSMQTRPILALGA